jgi:hypothetical protein
MLDGPPAAEVCTAFVEEGADAMDQRLVRARKARLRSLCSLKPSSFPAVAIDSPALTRLTASSLSSAVYALLQIFISLPFKVTSILRYLWEPKFQGKLKWVVKGGAVIALPRGSPPPAHDCCSFVPSQQLIVC